MALDPQDFHTVFPAVVQSVYLQITDVTHGKSYDRQLISMLPYAGKIPVDESKFSWNSSGELTLVDSAVNLAAPGAIGATTPSAAQFTTLGATAPAAASTALTVKGAAAQSGNLTEWKNSSGTVLTAVDPAGTVKFTGGTAFSIGLKAPSSLAGNLTYTLPVAPTAGAYLTTDNSGNMSWVTSSSSIDATGLTGLTQGSIPFAAASGLSQDNSTLFWDDVNKRLGLGTASPATSLDVSGNLRVSNLRTYALTRALSTTADDTILLGSLAFASKSASVTLKVVMSGFGAAKTYFLPLSNDQTSGAWKEVMPLTASKEGTDNFAVDVNVNTTTATFRLRRVAGATAGTAYISFIHEGAMSDTFTAASTTGNSAAPGSYYSSSLLTMTAGGITAGGAITLPGDPTSALHAATKQYVDSTVAAGVASGVTAGSTATFTAKTIDADSNTISNISNASIKASAAIDDTKLATISTAGKVSGAAITSGTIAGSTAVSTSGDIATTGKIGIGAAAGTAKLEITGAGATSATSALNVMNSTPTSLLYVRNDGNIGVGTASPSALLSIKGNASNESNINLVPFANGNTTGINFQTDAAAANAYITNTPNTGILNLGSTVAINLNSAMYVKTDNVGIGGTTPFEKLEVTGGSRVGKAPTTLLTVSGAHTNSVTTITASAATSGYPSAGTLLIGSEAITYTGISGSTFTGCTRASLGTTAAAYSGGETINNYLQTILTSSTTPKMVVTGAGNVGIGTTSPTAKLDASSTNVSATAVRGFAVTSGGNVIGVQGIAGRNGGNPSGQVGVFGRVGNAISQGIGGHFSLSTTESDLSIPAYITSRTIHGALVADNMGTTAPIFAGLDNGSSVFQINDGGNVGIGTTSPGYKLTVNGEPGANGYTAFTNYSDRRLKRDINPISDGILEKVLALKPSSFYYNELSGYDEETRNRKVNGFIAQELREVFPEMVHETKIHGKDYFDTNLSSLQIYLVKAVQELKSYVDSMFGSQSREIAELKAANAALTAKVEAENAALKAEKDAEIAQLKAVICELKPDAPLCAH
ncbi:MAG: tail fiber domain-containing protein [Proteobacteria bacterium]|nr:tail fiber domain-containing protein [Pseudomonadota bacterium]